MRAQAQGFKVAISGHFRASAGEPGASRIPRGPEVAPFLGTLVGSLPRKWSFWIVAFLDLPVFGIYCVWDLLFLDLLLGLLTDAINLCRKVPAEARRGD